MKEVLIRIGGQPELRRNHERGVSVRGPAGEHQRVLGVKPRLGRTDAGYPAPTRTSPWRYREPNADCARWSDSELIYRSITSAGGEQCRAPASEKIARLSSLPLTREHSSDRRRHAPGSQCPHGAGGAARQDDVTLRCGSLGALIGRGHVRRIVDCGGPCWPGQDSAPCYRRSAHCPEHPLERSTAASRGPVGRSAR